MHGRQWVTPGYVGAPTSGAQAVTADGTTNDAGRREMRTADFPGGDPLEVSESMPSAIGAGGMVHEGPALDEMIVEMESDLASMRQTADASDGA